MFSSVYIVFALGLLAAPPIPPGEGHGDGAADAAEAGALHEKAKAEVARGRLNEAVDLWRQAMARSPEARFALNICITRAAMNLPLEAWAHCRQASQLGVVNPEHRTRLAEVTAELEATLLTKYARLQLQVPVKGASVTRNGVPWPPPWDSWTDDERTDVVVSAPGHKPVAFTWLHARGKQYERVVDLVPAPVEPEPLPEPQPVIEVVTAPPPERNDFGVAKWSTLGGAVALLGVGGGLVGWSATIDADIGDTATASTFSSYEAYSDWADDRASTSEAAAISGYTAIGVGGALLITSVVLMVLDDGPDDGHVSFAPTLLPAGAGASARIDF